MAGNPGISYIRTTRGAYPVIYEARETFALGGSKVLRSSERDDVTLVGAGVTLHECVKAAELLGGEGIQARVVDCYSVKPIDAATLSEAAAATSGRIVVAEDHHPEGGLGSAVIDCLLSNGPDEPPRRAPGGQGHAGLGHGGGAHRVGRHRRRPHRGRGAGLCAAAEGARACLREASSRSLRGGRRSSSRRGGWSSNP